ncbi:MAG: polyprenyl synthetase family protein [Anaerolineales bacterium]|nr:polyprenyl synthetase family protein [Anaerolineales bacterium]
MMQSSSLVAVPETYKVEPYDWMTPVYPALLAVEQRLQTAPPEQHEWLGAATAHLLASGGKRIRPAVSLLAAGIFEVDFERAVHLAAGVEMLHTATLVHDDLIDGANMRRGAPTLNAVSGADAAILVGDYLFARAANLVAQTDHVGVMDEFAKTLMVILNGEVVQRFNRWQVDRQAYQQRIYAKTAALFVLAAQAPALLGNASESARQSMVDYGQAIGLAFQIVDDVLDYVGDPAKIGKPAGGDLRQGLITLPLIRYIEMHPNDPEVGILLAKRDGNHPLVAALIEKVRHSSAIQAALDEARGWVEQAQHALECLPLSIYTQALSELTVTIVERAM